MVQPPVAVVAVVLLRRARASRNISVQRLLDPGAVVRTELAGGERRADIGPAAVQELELEFGGIRLELACAPDAGIEACAGVELGGGEPLSDEIDADSGV